LLPAAAEVAAAAAVLVAGEGLAMVFPFYADAVGDETCCTRGQI